MTDPQPGKRPTPAIRHSSRALLLDEEDLLLLFSSKDEADGSTFWYPVGGGIKKGESPEDALRREVEEETGLKDLTVGPQIWYRKAVASWGGNTYDCRERFFLCRVPHFTIDTSGFSQGERDTVSGHHWWTQDELASTADRLVPADLAPRLRAILADGVPDVPDAVSS
ncbi:NUDIX hydrolase [Streptomyces iconiensis]|uniref:NUDIX domain-containing protein n=1 Tax=Streptomyces iconiensis TaxID=1384038 RepID=A0ABT6ZNX8_9ACTN|nr:NUDIX domain-containing protein [Streptomyces iconiensis]MDJ1130760.1 NUDIX domain-containing protein [Streptomyces iconiensis]